MNRFDRISRNFLSVVRSIFAKTYPNFMTFDHIFKTKRKISMMRTKNSYVFGQISKSILAKKIC